MRVCVCEWRFEYVSIYYFVVVLQGILISAYHWLLYLLNGGLWLTGKACIMRCVCEGGWLVDVIVCECAGECVGGCGCGGWMCHR